MPDRTQDAIAILERLVSFDTTSHLSNLEIIDYIQDYLAGHGIASTLVPHESEPKASLFASIGPGSGDGIALSAHTDVVPVEGQDWSSDPFTLVERESKLFGRGACDMKGFLAATLAMVPDFVAADLARPIHLAYSYDEEVGCTGARPMVNKLGGELPRPAIVIVGEPTEMRPVDAHKSIFAYETIVTGHETHSSVLDQGVNAVTYGARIVAELEALNTRLREIGDPTGRFRPGWSTVHVGEIDGGTALNIVPRKCRIHWEIRGLPDDNPPEHAARLDAFAAAELVPEMHAIAPETSIETRELVSIVPLHPDPGSAAETLVKRLTRSNTTEAVSYGTEAGLFQGRGIPTVVCGPGSIEQAHKPDEWLAVSELTKCIAFLTALKGELAN